VKRFLSALVIAYGLTGEDAAANACLTEAVCAAAPCPWSAPATWTDASCGASPGIPGAGDTWTIGPGHAVLYDLDGWVTGRGAIFGALTFDESPQGRDADGYRTLTILASANPSDADLALRGGGTLRLRRGDRMFFGTLNGTRAAIFIDNGGVFDAQGAAYLTRIAALQDVEADTADCGERVGRKFIITPEGGMTHARRFGRVVFRSGKARNRHYEIRRTSEDALIVCTDLPDEVSGGDARPGQRLTPHADFSGSCTGAGEPISCCTGPGTGSCRSFPVSRHSTPAPYGNDACLEARVPYECCTGPGVGACVGAVPAVGDEIAIVNDVWLGQSEGSQGLIIVTDRAGNNPAPILYAVNIGNLSETSGIRARVPNQPIQVVEYLNIHDSFSPTTTPFGYSGFRGLTVRWSAFHDTKPQQADTQAGLGNGSIPPDRPADDNVYSDNILYRLRGVHIHLNEGGGMRVTGSRLLRNLIFDGCTTLNSECAASQVDACDDCEVAHNVIYDFARGDNARNGFVGGCAGARCVVHDNWLVNFCGTGWSPAGNGSTTETIQSSVTVHNYVSHSRDRPFGGSSGRLYGNVAKNWGLQTSGTPAVQAPFALYGNFFGMDDAVDASADCTGAYACALQGVQLTLSSGIDNLARVTLLDNVFVLGSSNSTSVSACLNWDRIEDPDFPVAADHITCDGRGRTLRGVQMLNDAAIASAIRIDLSDWAHLFKNDAPTVSCTNVPGQAFGSLGNHWSLQSPLRSESGGPDSRGSCVPEVGLTRVSDFRFLNRAGWDFNYAPGAPGLTGGTDGSAIGSRAFRFDRGRLNAVWGGVLTFDGLFPADIANGVDNADMDGDGILDLHDICPTVPNPAQVDADGDGFAACAGDCDDSNPGVNPAAAETCNAVDDDCDGAADEDLGRVSCGVGSCARSVDVCRWGVLQECAPGEPAAEVCDGIDNDCDGIVDGGEAGLDADADSVPDACDGCPRAWNPYQEDFDGDREGDVCDLDDGLIWTLPPDASSVDWQPEQGYDAFNLYRGDLAVLRQTGAYTQDPVSSPLALRSCGLLVASIQDEVTLAPGEAVFYLVTGVSGGVESSLGTDSSGTERVNSEPCASGGFRSSGARAPVRRDRRLSAAAE
jgi:hypothetical protein